MQPRASPEGRKRYKSVKQLNIIQSQEPDAPRGVPGFCNKFAERRWWTWKQTEM